MDRITAALLADFRTREQLEAMAEDDAFENFANYCILSSLHSDTFDVADIWAGGGHDTSLDGVAILVNGNLVTSVDEVDDLEQFNGYLDVTFVLVQAKRSANFNASEIGSFGFGAMDFFEESPRLPRNEAITQAARVQTRLYERSVAFRKGRPKCLLFYVSTGAWNSDPEPTARAKQIEADLGTTELFDDVIFMPIGASELRQRYQASKERLSVEIVFEKKVVLPPIEGVSQAFLGVLPLSEYRKLIADDQGNMRGGLFDANVRAFQDYNAINQQIKETLRSTRSNQFTVLNNGVTVVARSLQPTGDRILIEDYQIVNGCQTSHVLFDALDDLETPVYIPIKIVATEDDGVMTAIAQATNSQTAVKSEDLQSLTKLQKALELYFGTFDSPYRLYYERRSRQYANMSDIEKVRVVSLGGLIRAFGSMFLDEPHRASRYYATLLKSIGSQIFTEDHRHDPYYTSAFAAHKLEFFFRNRQLGTQYKPARWHLIMTLRHLTAGPDLPPMNSGRIVPYCQRVLEVLWDDATALDYYERAAGIVEAVVGSRVLDRDLVKTQAFTDEVKMKLQKR